MSLDSKEKGIISATDLETHTRLLALADWQRKWLLLDDFAYIAASNALDADAQRFMFAAWQLNLYRLQIGTELSTCDAGDFCSNTAQILCFTTNFDAISKRCGFRTNITLTGHQSAPTASKNAFRYSIIILSGYDRVTRLRLKTYILSPVAGGLNRTEEYTRFTNSHNAKHQRRISFRFAKISCTR